MSFHVVGSLPLGGINIAANASVAILGSLTAELDLMLFGSFGLGTFGAQLSLLFDAHVSAALSIGLQFTNPLEAIELTLSALVNIQASLSAALNLPIPSIQVSAQLSANASITAALGLQLGGIQLLIAAALAVKLPAIDFLASLTASLAAGPVVVASWGFADAPDLMINTGSEIFTAFSSGFGGLLPTDHVSGVMLITKTPSASVAISSILLVV